MAVTEYDVGPGAYGVALAADGAVWTSLTGRGELARVGPDGTESRSDRTGRSGSPWKRAPSRTSPPDPPRLARLVPGGRQNPMASRSSKTVPRPG